MMTLESGFPCPQCKIVPLRLLGPDTIERLLNNILELDGIRRVLLNGHNIPLIIPYGPARGIPNETTLRRSVSIKGTDFNLRLQVGDIILEVHEKPVIESIKEICDDFFTEIPYQLYIGTFMKYEASLVDYAKYGPNADPACIGLADPRSKEKPVILSPVDQEAN